MVLIMADISAIGPKELNTDLNLTHSHLIINIILISICLLFTIFVEKKEAPREKLKIVSLSLCRPSSTTIEQMRQENKAT